MTDLITDGKYKVSFVTTLSSTTSPTATQIAAGVQLDGYITPSGLTRPWTANSIDNSRINSTFTTSATGRRSIALSVTIIRTTADSSGIEAALVFQAAGFLVIRDNIDASTAWTAAQTVEVYPVQVQQGSKSDPAANSLQTIAYGFDMTASPTLVATVA